MQNRISSNKIKDITKIISKKYEPDKIILFGSYATNNYNKNSDIDLLIIKDSNEPRYKRGRVVRKFLYNVLEPIDIIVYTNSEIEKEKEKKYTFINEILKNGKILYERKTKNCKTVDRKS